MGDYRRSQTNSREQYEPAPYPNRAPQSSGHFVWKLLAGAAAGLVLYGVVTSLHDIRRYIRISRM